jgi:hypothetical protein
MILANLKDIPYTYNRLMFGGSKIKVATKRNIHERLNLFNEIWKVFVCFMV